MGFDVNQTKIHGVLAGDYKYVIPRYQRKYVWEEKQWRELFDDIKYCVENRSEAAEDWSHFLGSFVFETDEKKKELVVIDGQQRLTTIVIMLCSICVLFNENGDKSRFEGVKKYILGTGDDGKPFFRVNNEELINFNKLIDATTDYTDECSKGRLFRNDFFSTSPKDNVNVKKCFTFFYEQFKEYVGNSVETINVIREKITDLDVIDIRATSSQESYNIFEILNARGVDLEQHELIKNYIFKYIQPKSTIDQAKMDWKELENNLFLDDSSRMKDFFASYITHKYKKPEKNETEFQIIKKNCSREEMRTLLDDLCQKCKIFRWFYEPEKACVKQVTELLKLFKELQIRHFRPLLLSLFSVYKSDVIDKKQLEYFVRQIENFYFAHGLVCAIDSKYLESTIHNNAVQMERASDMSSIEVFFKKLSTYYPNYSQFEENFLSLGYSKKVKTYQTPMKINKLRYILIQIERQNLKTTGELEVNKISIEHIANDDGNDAHCRIGNLLLLSETINNKIGNKTFSEKLEYYKNSHLISVKDFLERYGTKKEWTENEIRERGKHLAKLAYKDIWKFDFK